MVFVSPGVYVREQDFSDYVPNLSTTQLGMVGAATKGPLDEVVTITNEADLVRTFNAPTLDDYALHAAAQFLRAGRTLRFVRVAGPTVDTAEVSVNDLSALPVFTVEAASPGSWGNDTTVTVSAGSGAGLYNIAIAAPPDNAGSSKASQELYRNVSLDSLNDRYIETVINEGIPEEADAASEYIRITVVDGTRTPVSGDYDLTGGNDGISSLTDSEYIGGYIGQTATGIQNFRNPEILDVNLLAVPGVTSPAVIGEMLQIAEARADAFALVDPPLGLDVDGIVDWHNGTAPYSHGAFDSSYGALYWSWIKVLDPYSGKELFVPPSGLVAQKYAYNDQVSFPWFAPAGLNRGRITNAIGLEMSPDLGQRDTLYGNGNAVNPIVDFATDGITIWGQRTLQRRSTALDRVNVRRMMLYLEKAIATATRVIVFEQNDTLTRQRFVNLVRPFISRVQGQRGIQRFSIVCDQTNNPPSLVDRNEMNGRILIQPTKSAEIITLDFVLTSSGANFQELA